MVIGLFVILGCIFVLPFCSRKISEELEIFLFIMGIFAVSITVQWELNLAIEALTEPLFITVAVLAAGVLFKYLQGPIDRNLTKIVEKMGQKLFVFVTIVALGLLSSIITAIIAALVLVETAHTLNLDKNDEIKFIILACFAIGFGSVLTPGGGPLATITIAKLRSAPYFADFWFLFNDLWYYIFPAIVAIGLLSLKFVREHHKAEQVAGERFEETLGTICKRAVKIYLFIMGLVFLGAGFTPLIDLYIAKVPYYFLYWVNIISAILDNATLAAAEIGPSMTLLQITAATLGLVIAGGMLIPGNIPNIIAANTLKIKSKEWARVGVPLGLAIMLVVFVVIVAF